MEGKLRRRETDDGHLPRSKETVRRGSRPEADLMVSTCSEQGKEQEEKEQEDKEDEEKTENKKKG